MNWKRAKEAYMNGSMSDGDLAWLAGLLEGEGYFGRGASSPTVSVQMNDQDVVERAGKLMGSRGVTSGRHPTGTTFYKTGIYGNGAIELMQRLVPYMGLRRKEKIEETLRLAAARPGRSGPAKLRSEHIPFIKELYARGQTQEKIGTLCGVRHTTIGDILRGVSWT